ncbi:MAG TPA: DnaB-like helicase N-terminal domain-containing protein [Polyangia bacterium]|nr:DnaB-like helicase N-terminal domain-containing protein [Polyangia bacterium]
MSLAVVGDNDVARTPPHNIEAEKSVLGAIFIKPAALDEVSGDLQVDDFFLPAHREIYETMRELVDRGHPIDYVAVADQLSARGVLSKLEGGESYLLALANAVPTAENAQHYARLVREKAGRRRAIALAAELSSRAYGTDDLAEVLEEGRARLADLATAAAPRVPMLAACAVTVTDEWLTESLSPHEHLLTDVRTGLGALDKTGTWLFAGAGGAGKSYATVDLALAVATGRAWYCLATSGRPGRVLMLVAEDVADDVRRRMKRVADRRYLDASVQNRIVVLPLRGQSLAFVNREQFTGNYIPGAGLRDVIAFVEAEREAAGAPFALVILDPLARLAGVSLDKDSAAATAIIDACDRLSDAAGGLVLVAAHTNKVSRSAEKRVAESADVRGSTGLIDGARGVLQLMPEVEADTKEPTGRSILSITKANHVARWADIVLLRGDSGVLEPLDEVDRAIWEAERKKPAADGKQAAREARALAQIAADALVVRQVMADGYTGRLRTAVQARIGCGQPRADLAIARVKDEDSRVLVSRGVLAGTPQDTQDTAAGSVSPQSGERDIPPYPPGARDTGTPAVAGAPVSLGTPQDTEDTGTPAVCREPGEDDTEVQQS